mmetsp:Transcript_5657/g.8188  ORF Transcript_5657/g.8188 Transcript_5657/m.8188 type:complete len:107 (-) Transcript_5657:1146-1466(-)
MSKLTTSSFLFLSLLNWVLLVEVRGRLSNANNNPFKMMNRDDNKDSPSLWDCLLEGSDGPSCAANSQGGCVWCAEPIYGLCVTPSAAKKIGIMPFFNCESKIRNKK